METMIEMELLRKHIQQVETGLNEIKNGQVYLSNQVGKLDDDVRSIMGALSGTQIGGTGLVKRLEELEAFRKDQEKMRNKVMGGLVIIGILWTLFLKFFDKIFPNL